MIGGPERVVDSGGSGAQALGKSTIAGGLERTRCSGWDVGSAARVVEGGVESMRVTGNLVETVGSSNRGRKGLTPDKGNIDSIKRT